MESFQYAASAGGFNIISNLNVVWREKTDKTNQKKDRERSYKYREAGNITCHSSALVWIQIKQNKLIIEKVKNYIEK